MTGFRERKTWIVFIAVLLLFAACKGETPTAPPTGGGVPPGTTPPPTGVSVTLAVSNANPLVDSSVTITATVTENGQPVPNGTAVEFRTTAGVLDSSGDAIIKTTTAGVATVTLTSSTAGTARVTATVNNVARQTDVNFVARPVTPTPPNTAPTITGVTPNIGRPTGGETVRITGTNFRGPVKVLFRFPNAIAPTEVTVAQSTETFIDVITPGVNLGVAQQLVADIIVLTQAGTASENRVERTGAFTFRSERLTPSVFSVTPNSGPVTGGTRVSILGEGFQEPVQVLFDTAEARVLNVKFNEILVDTPAARDTPDDGAGPVLGAVPVTVRNLNSQTSSTLAGGFNYKSAIVITGVTLSSAGDLTRMTIDGNGFVSPVIVVVRTAQGDIGLGQISVTGTRIVATVPRIVPTNCAAPLEGPVVVTNVVNGDSALGPVFRFAIPIPTIVDISPSSVTVGVNSTFNVTVANALPTTTRFIVGGKTVFPTGFVDNGDGTVTFTVPVPTNLEFPTIECPGGERLGPIDVDVVYDVTATGCDDTAADALLINPADSSCVTPPPPTLSVSPAGSACAPVPNTVAAGAATGTTTIVVSNTAAAGAQDLRVTSVGVSNQVNGTFTVSPLTATIPAGSSANFTVTVDPTAPGAFSADVQFTTNAGTDTVCITGNGT